MSFYFWSSQSNTEEKQTHERQRDRERELFENAALSQVCSAKTPPGSYLF